MIDLMRSWYSPSDPSRFRPKVRFSVEGSVSPVKIAGCLSTSSTSAQRVTSHSSTAGTHDTGSSSRSLA